MCSDLASTKTISHNQEEKYFYVAHLNFALDPRLAVQSILQIQSGWRMAQRSTYIIHGPCTKNSRTSKRAIQKKLPRLSDHTPPTQLNLESLSFSISSFSLLNSDLICFSHLLISLLSFAIPEFALCQFVENSSTSF
jgi:hypothetical protein